MSVCTTKVIAMLASGRPQGHSGASQCAHQCYSGAIQCAHHGHSGASQCAPPRSWMRSQVFVTYCTYFSVPASPPLSPVLTQRNIPFSPLPLSGREVELTRGTVYQHPTGAQRQRYNRLKHEVAPAQSGFSPICCNLTHTLHCHTR